MEGSAEAFGATDLGLRLTGLCWGLGFRVYGLGLKKVGLCGIGYFL